VPAGCCFEIVVCDNASTDDTAGVVERISLPNFPISYVFEPVPGQCRAYNRAIAASRGEILLFTDDDVIVPGNWLTGMAEPILSGEADQVVGGIRTALHLIKPWMTTIHLGWFADTTNTPRDARGLITGANMAVSRRVFEKVPRFDEETGPGALGHASDTLFALQLDTVGFRKSIRLDVEVEHHFDEERLTRAAFERQANRRGEFGAYLDYHWLHLPARFRFAKFVRAWLRLNAARVLRYREWRDHPAVPAWELPLLDGYYHSLHVLKTFGAPRKYEERGLVKLQP